jgi:hypothetical protein
MNLRDDLRHILADRASGRVLCFLRWADVELADIDNANLRVSGERQGRLSPKGYEERPVPVHENSHGCWQNCPARTMGLAHERLEPTNASPRRLKIEGECGSREGRRRDTSQISSHLRYALTGKRLRRRDSTARLMGHSDLDITRQYLDAHERLKRIAVNRFSLRRSGSIGHVR